MIKYDIVQNAIRETIFNSKLELGGIKELINILSKLEISMCFSTKGVIEIINRINYEYLKVDRASVYSCLYCLRYNLVSMGISMDDVLEDMNNNIALSEHIFHKEDGLAYKLTGDDAEDLKKNQILGLIYIIAINLGFVVKCYEELYAKLNPETPKLRYQGN